MVEQDVFIVQYTCIVHDCRDLARLSDVCNIYTSSRIFFSEGHKENTFLICGCLMAKADNALTVVFEGETHVITAF